MCSIKYKNAYIYSYNYILNIHKIYKIKLQVLNQDHYLEMDFKTPKYDICRALTSAIITMYVYGVDFMYLYI